MQAEGAAEAAAIPRTSARSSYPGSRTGGKTRYDLPRRRRASGTEPSEVSQAVAALSLLAATPDKPGPLALAPAPVAATPRAPLRSTGRAVVGDPSPELPLVTEDNDVHGVLVLGGKEAGKTSLVLSLAAAVNGAYPTGPGVKEKREIMPTHGQSYEIPAREVRLMEGGARQMRVILTDTPPCGTSKDEQPLCTRVSPNSNQHKQVVPSWMRVAMRSGNKPHYAVLFCVDATAAPLWEDTDRCSDVARLLTSLRRSQYTVVVAVTKLLKAREDALRDRNLGNEGNLDPRNSYETFASRYVEKVSTAIQAASAGAQDGPSGPGNQAFPVPNFTIFDVPTWSGAIVFKSWQTKIATVELPNLRYATSQLKRLLAALSLRSCKQ